MKQQLIQRLKNYVEKHHMIEEGDHILVGVSGGADSVCLLYVLNWFYNPTAKLRVLHVNHGVREDAHEDALFVENLCKEWEIPCDIACVDMPGYAKEHHLSSEEAGRVLRYQLFMEYAERYQCNKIAVAHHGDDQAETVLLNLFRGTGLRGLGGMDPVRKERKNENARTVIRPLLCFTREEIEGILQGENIDFCTDYTNAQDIYTRNKVRHHILEYANREINVYSSKHICDLADRTRQMNQYFRDVVEQAYQRIILSDQCINGAKIVLNVEKLREEHPVIQKELFLHCFEQVTPGRKDIGMHHVELVEKLLETEGTKECHFPYRIIVEKSYEKLIFHAAYKRTIKLENKQLFYTYEDAKVEDIPDVDWDSNAHQESYEEPVEYVENPSLELTKMELETLSLIQISFSTHQKLQFRLINRENTDRIQENLYTKWFDYDKIKSSVHIRKRQTGDYFIFNKQGQKKTIKNYMIDEKIPKNQRDTMYLIAEGSHVLWLPGYRISEWYKVDPNTKRILEIRLQEE